MTLSDYADEVHAAFVGRQIEGTVDSRDTTLVPERPPESSDPFSVLVAGVAELVRLKRRAVR